MEIVTIGSQFWSLKNLDISHYNNGDEIPEVTDNLEWGKLTTGAWCYYENDSNNGLVYGKLYNWYAINDPRGFAPEGWRIPADKDWNKLIKFLGGKNIAGGKMKDVNTSNWLNPNSGASNSSGFTALPGGYRRKPFNFIGFWGKWWSSTEYDKLSSAAWNITLNSENEYIGLDKDDKMHGFSVRLIKN